MARLTRTLLHAACFGLVLQASPIRAQSEAEDDWKQNLRDQLSQENNCELSYMTDVRQFTFFDGVVANGRAHCLDKRQFDFTWAGQKMKFDIERCGTAVC